MAVLIGNDVFNSLLARWLKARGVTTIAYFPPQVWLWGALARSITRGYDVMLTSFPEEQSVYERANPSIDVTFVGHYLVDELSQTTPRARSEARACLGLDPRARIVGLLPGSRIQEVRSFTPVLLAVAHRLLERDSAIRFVLPIAEPDQGSGVTEQVRRRNLEDRVTLCESSREAMKASDLSDRDTARTRRTPRECEPAPAAAGVGRPSSPMRRGPPEPDASPERALDQIHQKT